MSLKDKLINSANILGDLHRSWTPHSGQVPIGKALFYDGKKFIFMNCGRKIGKSELIIYSLSRWGMSFPGSSCYYIAPFFKQAKEIIWANNRIQNFLEKEIRSKYIVDINNTELRVRLKNGSFIKLDGADNFNAYRGINPHIIAYDEFKDHNPNFHIGMEPNLATHKAPCLFFGTPPETEDNHFWRIADSVSADPDGAYFNFPTHMNPHIDKEWLEKTRLRLIARGEEDVWLREYMAMRVFGGKNAIFPMLSDDLVIRFSDAIQHIKRNRKHWQLYCTADPATSSVFAVLFSAINKYTREVIHLDEIYETKLSLMSSRPILAAVIKILNSIDPDTDNWVFTRDEAAAWFMNEILDLTKSDIYFAATTKSKNDKGDGLSLIKDQINAKLWKRTEKCIKLDWEMKNYIKDDKGAIPKKNDHLIDSMRYTNGADNYSHVPEDVEDDSLFKPLEKRGYTIEEDWKNDLTMHDWTFNHVDYEDIYDGTFDYE